MRKFNQVIVLCLLTIGLYGQAKAQCTSNFGAANLGNGLWQFTDSSTSQSGVIVAWSWNFGDGNIANTRDAIHQFAANGTYLVCLTITTSNFCSTNYCEPITVSDMTPPCSAGSFTADPANQTVCVGNGLSFMADTVGAGAADSLQWEESTDGNTWVSILNVPPYSGANSLSLSINPATIGMDGNMYRCIAFYCGVSMLTDTSGAALLTVIQVSSSVVVDNNVSCNGGSDGAATASGADGIPPYSYNWFNGDTTPSITGLSAGDYLVTVTDSIGCNVEDTVSISEPLALMASIVVDNNISCAGASNGAATASGSGGSPGYSYMWSTLDSTASISGLSAGTYYVTVTDTNNCTAMDSVTFTDPIPVTASATVDNNVTCNGASDGAATANGSGGTPGYSYLWSNNDSSATITGLAAGTYFVTVTDTNGCTASDSVTITQPDALVASAVVDNNVNCFGDSTGAATASAIGGTMPYSFIWSNGDTTASISGLAAGSYDVMVLDSNNCADADTITITESTQLVITTQEDSGSTCGNPNGGATAMANGGNPGYSYLWSNGETTASITGISSGTYRVTVTDSTACTAVDSVTISGPPELLASIVVDNEISCAGDSNGAATASGSGGSPPYSYMWSTLDSSASISGLSPGTYYVTVSDSNNCTAMDSVTFTDPTPVMVAVVADNNVSCNGNSDGAATATGSGGTPAYSFLWSNNDTTSTITGLMAGTYFVTLTDSNGCTASDSVTITQPDSLIASAVVDNHVNCFGDATGAATGSAIGGTLPYSFFWSSGDTTATATGLAAGFYELLVADSNNCLDSASVTITQPDSALWVTTQEDSGSTCGQPNGQATAMANGGTQGYSYLWSNGDSTATAMGLSPGTYWVTVTDANLCSAMDSVIISSDDTIPPVAACQNATIYLDSFGMAMLLPSEVDSGSTDNCPGDSLSVSSDMFSCSEIGSNMVILTITDASGNWDTCSATVMVEDTMAPFVKCLNPTVYLDSSGMVVIDIWTLNDSTYDNCGIDSGWVSQDTFWCGDIGTVSVTLTAADEQGISDSCIATVTVSDTLPPILYCATDTSIVNDSALCSAPHTYIVTNSDNCGGDSLWLESGIGSGGTFPVGENTETWVASDANGNTDTCWFKVTVLDTEAPVFTFCPPDTNVLTDSADVARDVSWAPPVATDNCSVDSMQASYTNPTDLSVGTHWIEYVAADSSWNTDTCRFKVTVNFGIRIDAVTDTLTCGYNFYCNGDTTGWIAISAFNGTPPYAYAWDTGDTTDTISGLVAGAYSITVTDSTGQTTVSTYTLVEPDPVTASFGGTLGFCSGDTTTTIDLTPWGGADCEAYAYNWTSTDTNFSSTQQDVFVDEEGMYYVTITDSNGCWGMDSVSIQIGGNVPLTATSWGPDTICTADTLTLLADHGFFNYVWSNGDSSRTTEVWDAGTYYVSANDSSNCPLWDSVNVTQLNQPDPNPVVHPGYDVNLCAGGTVDLDVGYHGTYTSYKWYMVDSTGMSVQILNRRILTVTTEGQYFALVRNNFGCSEFSDTVTVTEVPIPAASISQNGNTLTANPQGAGFTYKWGFNGAFISGATADTLNATQNGDYFVRVKDGNGCLGWDTLYNFVVGIGSVLDGTDLDVFPNPSNGTLFIRTEFQLKRKVQLSVSDMYGKTKWSAEMKMEAGQAYPIPAENWAKGIYFLKLSTDNGTVTKRIVIQ